MTNLESRRKALSAQLAAFGSVPKKKETKAYTHTAVKYKSLGARPLPWAPKKTVIKKKLGSIKSPITYESLQVKDGYTPQKGRDYFTEQEVEQIKNEIAQSVKAEIPPKLESEIVVDIETVKKIVQMMHQLPEVDKLEVSKGIRNAQSFIYKGTKYGMEEMMHGGSASTGGYQQPTSGVVNGVNQVFTWASAPSVIVVDQGRAMQRVSSDGSVNWVSVGLTTTMSVAPTFDIYATS